MIAGSAAPTIVAVSLVALATVLIGGFGLRLSRTTSDFYVASRGVGPVLNASAISGEYLSAASFLGVAGLILARGADVLWLPLGWTTGYLLLLVFVAAPLRRSGAYTLPDFAQLRLESLAVRRVASLLVVLIGLLYLVPQFQGAGLTMRTITGAPRWAGAVLVSLVVGLNVVAGGMRSVTFAQAFLFWLKLAALLTPAFFLVARWTSQGSPTGAGLTKTDWVEPLSGEHALYLTYSLILATFLGTMGLPHVVVRYYTNRDGRSARRTTVTVLVLLSGFYLLPTIYGVLGRLYAADLVAGGRTDSVVLTLPGRLVGGSLAHGLTALLGAGAFAAFLSTSSGLVISIAGVISQDLLRTRGSGVRRFRLGAVVAVFGALSLTLASTGVTVAQEVELTFAVAASTFAPLLLLGIWWRRLTPAGALAGLLTGGVLSSSAVLATTFGIDTGHDWLGAIIAQPAAVTVTVAFLMMVGVSLLTRESRPGHVTRIMVRLHVPEDLELDRGPFQADRPTVRRSFATTRQGVTSRTQTRLRHWAMGRRGASQERGSRS